MRSRLLLFLALLTIPSLATPIPRILVDCPSGCKTCSADGKKCLTCNSKHFLNESNNLCERCSSYCSKCDNAAACTICSPGFYLYDRKCFQDCPTQYGKTNDAKCKKCNVKCLSCSANADKCDTCEDGYYINSSAKCSQCMSNCLKCSSGTTCTTCASGYKKDDNGSCEKDTNWVDTLKKWLPWILGALLGLLLLCCLCYLCYRFLNQPKKYRPLENTYRQPKERSYRAAPPQQQPSYIYQPVYVPVEVEKPVLTNNVSYAAPPPPAVPVRNLNYSIPVTDNFGRAGLMNVSQIM